MKHAKEELAKFDNQNWPWFKTFEKAFLLNLLKAQDFFLTWRNHLHSAEFWNVSWLWTSFLMKICSLRIRFAIGQGAKKKLMHWMSSRIPKRYLDRGFPGCFRDGILLCALTEKLTPGACPRFDLLDPEQPLRNLKLALYLVEKHIKIKPDVTADEILQGGKFPEKRLLLLVAQLKLASEKFKLSAANTKSKKDYMSQTTFVSDKCFARGMGLLLAVRGRKACFTILLDSTENLDMVIEIRGPRNTACNKRITNIHCLPRSESTDLKDIMDAQVKEDILSKIIPLTYRIIGRKISVGYIPLESGSHNMSIIWQGQHIMGSPYTITVDSSIETPDIWLSPPTRGYCRLKRSDSQYIDESMEHSNQTNLSTCLENSSSVVRKRILRYIVKVDGNDVVIDGKEDLCEAINNIKQKLRNTSSHAEDHEEIYQYNILSDTAEQKGTHQWNAFSNSEEQKEILQQNAFLYYQDHKDICQQNTLSRSEQQKEICKRNAFLHIEDQNEICKQSTSSHTEEQKEICQQNVLPLTEEGKEIYQRNSSLQNEDNKEIRQLNALSLIEGPEEMYESHICSSNDAEVVKSSFNSDKNLCSENYLFRMNGSIKSEIDQNAKMNSNVLEIAKKLDQQEANSRDKNLKSFNENIPAIHLDNSTNPRLTVNKEVIALTNEDVNYDNTINKHYSELQNSNLVTNIKPYSYSESIKNYTVLDKNHEVKQLDVETASLENSDPYEPVVSVLNKKNSEFQFKARNLNTCSNLSLNLNVNNAPVFLNVNDDTNLFPVHKVEYQILHEEDEEDQDEFNPRRRRSFTELHESNYLDGDNNEADSAADAVEDISLKINEGADENSEDEALNYEGFLSSSSVESDSKSSIKANFALFDCDHSLAFWTETVSETPPDFVYGSSEHENISEEKISEMWENKLRELENESSAPDEEMSLELKLDQNNEMEYVKADSYLTYPCEFNENSDNIMPFPSESDKKMCDDVQLDTKTLNVQDLFDHRKRLSWSERGSLPCIQESSIEIYLESETCSENINRDLGDAFSFNKIETKVKLDAAELDNTSKSEVKLDENVEFGANLTTQNKACNSHSDNWTDLFNNKEDTDYRLDEKAVNLPKPTAESERKNTVMSMNILSASPYRNRSKEAADREVKNYAVTNLKSSPQQLPVASEPLVSSKSNSASENYILTYATPAVINDCIGLDGELNTLYELDNGKNSDEISHTEKYPEQKSAQCLSVKKVIEIFQKEKEEPIDTWPVVIPNPKSHSSSKKCQENLNGKEDAKDDLPVTEVLNFFSISENTPSVDISRSSIKDRVKLFENDTKEKYFPMKKCNNVGKCSNSTVSAKKNYWESMIS